MSTYYHGTTRESASQIVRTGFSPKRPSRAVWFTTSWDYAFSRAKQKAGRTNDRAAVLHCELNPNELRRHLGSRMTGKGGIIAIRAHVPPTVVRSVSTRRGSAERSGLPLTTSPKELSEWMTRQIAQWVNSLLRFKTYKGVKRSHPGVKLLADWVLKHYGTDLGSVPHGELLNVAHQWLPEFFDGVEVDPNALAVVHRVRDVKLEPEPLEEIDPREEEAFDCLAAEKSTRRSRGLQLLAEIGDADLFDWCAMFLDDESSEVVLTALNTMLLCDSGDTEIIESFAYSKNKRIRASAIAALTKHSDEDRLGWFERGLKDPEACVRLETVKRLPHLNPTQHQDLFEIARYDPNSEVKRLARKITGGQGFHDLR